MRRNAKQDNKEIEETERKKEKKKKGRRKYITRGLDKTYSEPSLRENQGKVAPNTGFEDYPQALWREGVMEDDAGETISRDNIFLG